MPKSSDEQQPEKDRCRQSVTLNLTRAADAMPKSSDEQQPEKDRCRQSVTLNLTRAAA